MKKSILSIILAGIWITFSEFLRNEILFKSMWINHFQSLGLKFETLPINGLLWTVWSFAMAYVIFKLNQKFSIVETFVTTWIASFVMMWIAAYNLQVLPLMLFVIEVPFSLVEIFVALLIIRKIK